MMMKFYRPNEGPLIKGMNMTSNVKETKEMLRFVLSLANVMSEIMDDGKVSLLELPKLLVPFRLMPAALKDVKMIVAEFKDLSKEEVDELTQEFMKEFNLKQDEIEAMIEKGMLVAAELAKIILSFKK